MRVQLQILYTAILSWRTESPEFQFWLLGVSESVTRNGTERAGALLLHQVRLRGLTSYKYFQVQPPTLVKLCFPGELLTFIRINIVKLKHLFTISQIIQIKEISRCKLNGGSVWSNCGHWEERGRRRRRFSDIDIIHCNI